MLVKSLLSLAVVLGVTALAGCGGGDEEADQTDSALVESNKVQFRLAAFIPCDGIDFFGVYDGDGRSFSYAGAAESSRALLDVTVDPEGFDPVTPRGFPTKKFSGSDVASQQGWCAQLKSNATPERTGYADLGRVFATVTDQPDSQGYAVTRAHLEMHAKNPLVFLAPNLDGVLDLDIYYVREGGKKKPKYVTYAGYHDPFPSWELYVDQVPMIQHDARRDGNGPTGLVPGAEISRTGLCTRQGATWSCVED
jgi:hypothetical protein